MKDIGNGDLEIDESGTMERETVVDVDSEGAGETAPSSQTDVSSIQMNDVRAAFERLMKNPASRYTAAMVDEFWNELNK